MSGYCAGVGSAVEDWKQLWDIIGGMSDFQCMAKNEERRDQFWKKAICKK
jgi:hypothetical protein